MQALNNEPVYRPSVGKRQKTSPLNKGCCRVPMQSNPRPLCSGPGCSGPLDRSAALVPEVLIYEPKSARPLRCSGPPRPPSCIGPLTGSRCSYLHIHKVRPARTRRLSARSSGHLHHRSASGCTSPERSASGLKASSSRCPSSFKATSPAALESCKPGLFKPIA